MLCAMLAINLQVFSQILGRVRISGHTLNFGTNFNISGQHQRKTGRDARVDNSHQVILL